MNIPEMLFDIGRFNPHITNSEMELLYAAADTIKTQGKKLSALEAENERLRAALCDRHKQGCRLLSILNPGPCDCGLEELTDDGISNYIGDE